jgi:hypothetical protein
LIKNGSKGGRLEEIKESRGAFAVVFSRMRFKIRCPVLQVSLPEVYNKTAEINGFTVLQLLFEDIRLCQTMHGRKNMAC